MGCVQCHQIVKAPYLDVPTVLIKDSQSTIDKTIVKPNQPKLDLSTESLNQTNIDPMLHEINIARTNPREYSNKISAVLDKIQYINGQHFLIYNDEIRIELVKGKDHFVSCINYLNEQSQQLSPLIFADDLKIPFPDNKEELVLCREYLSKEIERKHKETKGKYHNIDFHYDISPNPVVSTIVQLVDDTTASLHRRKNILNKNAKYVGISSGLMKKDIYCFYLLFAS